MAGGVKVPHLCLWDQKRSLPLLIMITEIAARWVTFVAFFSGLSLLSSLGRYSVKYRSMTWSSGCLNLS